MSYHRATAEKLMAKLGLNHLSASVIVGEHETGVCLYLMVDKSRLKSVEKTAPASIDGCEVIVRKRPKIRALA